MQNLILVKYRLRESELSNILLLLQQLDQDFNVAMIVIDKHEIPYIGNLAIFDAKDLIEFKGVAVFLDYGAETYSHKCSCSDKLLLNIDVNISPTQDVKMDVTSIQSVQGILDVKTKGRSG